MVRGNVDSLVKLIAALDAAGIEMIDEGATSHSQGRGVRLRASSTSTGPLARTRSEGKASSGTRTRT